ncbi:MAG TPA: ABC transporter substrate-binding protein [Casimicrobiaceae bacterium]|nr:ABC transporter substrate-binding protein [Casimicrobiaceae bacterium]
MKISLAENFRAVFYAPLYALRALDFAPCEGVTVEWLPAREPGAVFDEVKRGSVDLAWGGPMRVIKDRDTTPAAGDSLRCFGEIVARDPFYLLARPGWQGRGLSDLPGARLAVVSEVPTPWLCLQADLRDAGLALPAIADRGRVVTGLSMEQQLRALEQEEVDVVQLFEPHVSQAVAEGTGRIIHAASDRGATAYTTFICSVDGMARHRESFRRVTVALGRVQHWIATHDPDELAELIAPCFAGIASTLLHTAIRRYHDARIWARQTDVSRVGFDRLARSLYQGGFVRVPQSYEHCVADAGELSTSPTR